MCQPILTISNCKTVNRETVNLTALIVPQFYQLVKNILMKTKKKLLEHINELLENQFKCDFKMNKNDIMHIVLLETNSISDEELIKRLNPRLKEKYDKGDQKEKSLIIESVRYGMESTENEVNDFLKNELKVLGQKELIEIMKLKLPSQFHNALN